MICYMQTKKDGYFKMIVNFIFLLPALKNINNDKNKKSLCQC